MEFKTRKEELIKELTIVYIYLGEQLKRVIDLSKKEKKKFILEQLLAVKLYLEQEIIRILELIYFIKNQKVRRCYKKKK